MSALGHKRTFDALERVLTKVELGVLIKALAHIWPSAFTGTITRDEIVIALGEHADIWPRLILPHTCDSGDHSIFTAR
jgi:hypothetical protein